jgi:FAD/FMN-containing dehydrogenase
VSTTTNTGHPDLLEELRAAVAGDVFLPGDSGYDTAVAGFNLLVVQRPRLVVVAAGTDDVTAAVRFAGALGLEIAVQATGHGAARAAGENTLLINTSRLTAVRIDAEAATAEIGAGALWGHVLEPAQAHGLAPLLGSTTAVGAIGYTLGGGFGWLARKHGLATDSVLSFDLVTPDGRELITSAEENPELFWALKGGGGGSLGVVTRMRIRLYPVREVYAGNLLYPAELAGEILRRWRDWAPGTSTELTSAVTLMNFPPIPMVPEPLRGRSFVMIRGCFAGDLAEGERVMSFWRDWQPPVMDMFGPMPFAAADMISQDPRDPVPAIVSSEWFDRLDDEAIEVIVAAALPAPGQPPLIMMTELRNAGGAIRAGASAAANDRGRSGEFLLEMVSSPPSPHLVPVIHEHITATRRQLAPHVNGASYLNFLEGEEKQERTAAAFSPGHRERLATVKRALDPDNRFSHGFALG